MSRASSFVLALGTVLLLTSILFDSQTGAYRVLQITTTPTAFVYLPFVAKNWTQAVEGYIFHDMNGDGIWQPDMEPIIAGAEICLDQNCAISAEDGAYSITISNGDYDLRIDPHNETRPLDERFYYLNVSPSEPPFVDINNTIPFNVNGDLNNNFGLWQGYLIFPISEMEEGYMYIFNLPDTHAGDLYVRDFNGNLAEEGPNMFVPAANNHFGMDILASVGSPVYAPAWGKVIAAGIGQEGDLGADPNDASITIIHPNGHMSSYHHLQDIYVTLGDIVEAGEQIATSGDNFGNCTPHLHFDVLRGVPPEYFDIINDFREQIQSGNPYGFHLQYEGLFRNTFPPDEYTQAGNFISSDEYSLWVSEESLQDTPLMLHNDFLTTLGEYSNYLKNHLSHHRF